MAIPFSATTLLAELPRLRRYARILTDDPECADRLVEQTLACARQMPDESATQSSRTQLLALLRAVNAQTTVTNPPRETPPGAPPADPDPKADADTSRRIAQSGPDRGAEMLAQLRNLPLEQREVLVLAAVEQMSYVEIATLLHTPVATVISRLSQARETLRATSSKPQSEPNAS